MRYYALTCLRIFSGLSYHASLIMPGRSHHIAKQPLPMPHFHSLKFRPKLSLHRCLGRHDLPCRPNYSLAWGITCAAVRSGRVEAVDSAVRLRPSGSPNFCHPALSFRFQTGGGLGTDPPAEGTLISFAG